MTTEDKVRGIVGSIEVSEIDSSSKKKKHDSKAFLSVAADVKKILEDERKEEPLDNERSSH